ncbi:MAG: DUF2378 family protein [Candidatus Omnitrophota bacterium]
MQETTKGMYFNDVIKFITEKSGEQTKNQIAKELGKPLEYIGFKDYSIQELVLIQQLCIKYIFPEKTREQGMFELGKIAFYTFAKSLLGKVTLPFLKNNPAETFKKIPSWYMQINKFGSVEFEEIAEKKNKIIFKNYKNYPHYHHGLITQGMEVLGLIGTVSLTVHRFEELENKGDIVADFECFLEWK